MGATVGGGATGVVWQPDNERHASNSDSGAIDVGSVGSDEPIIA